MVPCVAIFLAVALTINAQAPAIQPIPGKLTASIAQVYRNHLVDITTGAESLEHSAKLGQILPQGAAAEASPVLPFMVVVTNNNAKAISSIIVRYVSTSRSGDKLGFGTVPVTLRGQELKMNESIAISPVTALTEKYFAARRGLSAPNVNVTGLVTQFQRSSGDAWKTRGVVVQVDSIVFENGGLIGPDQYGLLQERPALEAAVRDLSIRFSEWSGEEFEKHLQFTVKQPVSGFFHDDGSVDQIGLQRKVVAQDLLLIRKGRVLSKEELSKALQSLINSKPKLFRLQ